MEESSDSETEAKKNNNPLNPKDEGGDQQMENQKKEGDQEKSKKPNTEQENSHSDGEDEKTVEEIYCIAKHHYGSIYNLLGLCGPGTYIALGPTEAGKSFFIKQLYFYATSPLVKEEFRLKFYCILALSSTAKINEEYDWNPDIVKIKPSNEAISMILKARKEEMFEACEKEHFPKSHQEEWAAKNPMLIIMDDTYGMVDFSRPGNSCASLATKARHYGIYFVLAAQYVHQLGPVIRDNQRCWICFSTNAENHKEIIFKHHGKDQKELIRICTTHNRKAHHPIIYITTWRFRKNFGVNANRVLKMFPIPPIDKDVILDSSDESEDDDDDRYEKFEQDDHDFDEFDNKKE